MTQEEMTDLELKVVWTNKEEMTYPELELIMAQEEINYPELELMCQDICVVLGQNQYEELGLEVTRYCDLITTYDNQNFKIVQTNFCEGGYRLEVYHRGKEVLSSETIEIYSKIPGYLWEKDKMMEVFGIGEEEAYTINRSYLGRKEDLMQILGIGEEEANVMKRNLDFSEIEVREDYQRIQIDESNLRWIKELEKLHTLNWEKIRRELELGYLTQLEFPSEVKPQQHLNH